MCRRLSANCAQGSSPSSWARRLVSFRSRSLRLLSFRNWNASLGQKNGEVIFWAVLRIRNVYPGSWFLSIPDPASRNSHKRVISFLNWWRKKFGPIFSAYSGSRIRGQNVSGSRIRIRNTAFARLVFFLRNAHNYSSILKEVQTAVNCCFCYELM